MIKSYLRISLLGLACACNSIDNEELKIPVVISDDEWISSSTDSFINQILGGGEETIRGFNLGDPISEVISKENLEKFEEEGNLIGYTFETDYNEVVDVLYSHENNLLSEVQIDIYLNSDSVSSELSKGLGFYFTQKYGKPNIVVDKPIWSINATQEVVIENIATKLDRGLQVNFRKTN
jgi:hypothetical protein